MIECSCNVISDKQFKAAVAEKREQISRAASLKKAVSIVYHAARMLQEEEKRPHFRKPCRTCFNGVAAHIQEAGHFTDQRLSPCGRNCNDCSLACS